MDLMPKCNHCGYEFDDEEVWESNYKESGKVHTGESEVSELVCPNTDCGEKFYVECVHQIRFRPVDEDGELI